MPILNPEHLLEQADHLVATPTAGRPRQVDLRRAVSAAYYAVFHATLCAVADQFVGISQRNTLRYALVYRRPDHGAIKKCCEDLLRSTPPSKYQPYLAGIVFSLPFKTYASGFISLQEQRHSADYDPALIFHTLNARATIGAARTSITSLSLVSQDELSLFVTLLLCPPR